MPRLPSSASAENPLTGKTIAFATHTIVGDMTANFVPMAIQAGATVAMSLAVGVDLLVVGSDEKEKMEGGGGSEVIEAAAKVEGLSVISQSDFFCNCCGESVKAPECRVPSRAVDGAYSLGAD
jgi:hypothetical protein